MLDDLYTGRLLELAADIPRLGRLDAPDGSATAHAKLCGSHVTVDLRLDADGRISDFAQDVRACLLGQASSSLMARHVIGLDAGDVAELRGLVRAMLKEDGPEPEGRFADFAMLKAVRDFKARHASTLLTFDAVAEALRLALAARVPDRTAA